MIDVSHALHELIIFYCTWDTPSHFPAFKSCIHTFPLLFFLSSRHFLLLTLPHSRLTFFTTPFNRLCDKRPPPALWGQLCELPLCLRVCVSVRVCLCAVSVIQSFCQTTAVEILPFSPIEMCMSFIVYLKGTSRLSGSSHTHTHTHGQGSFCLLACLCRSVFSASLLAISQRHID